MTRGYGEQLGDALQDILNPPAPHVYFMKQIRNGLEYRGWERIDITVDHRGVNIRIRRTENGVPVALHQTVTHHYIGPKKYPFAEVKQTLDQIDHALAQWRRDNP